MTAPPTWLRIAIATVPDKYVAQSNTAVLVEMAILAYTSPSAAGEPSKCTNRPPVPRSRLGRYRAAEVTASITRRLHAYFWSVVESATGFASGVVARCCKLELSFYFPPDARRARRVLEM